MEVPPNIYRQLLSLLRQHSRYQDLRHLKTLAWMVTALIASGELSLPSFEPYVLSPAQKAQSYERRWKRWLLNPRIDIARLYLPLFMAAMASWKNTRVYLALDTTVLWNRYCMIHVSLVCGGRAIPMLWKVLEHPSATVEFREYAPLLRKAYVILRQSPEVMLLADRGFANQELLKWLKARRWHWAIRLPCDVLVSGPCSCPMEVRTLWPAPGHARFYHNVKLWSQARIGVNLALAYPQGVDEPWAIITDEKPSVKTFWQYGLRFCIEELFLDSKSGAFQLEESRFRHPDGLERLYLIAALAILYATVYGMTLQLKGLRQRVDPHWQRGLSYLKIGLRWLRGAMYKRRKILDLEPLLPQDPDPCFPSQRVKEKEYEKFLFSRLKTIVCNP